MEPDTPPPPTTISAAAIQLGVTKQTVHALIRDGELKSFKIRRARRILGGEVEAFIQRNMATTDSPEVA